MAPCSRLDKNQQYVSFISTPDGVLDWKAPNDRLHQVTQAIRHGTAITLCFLPRIMKLES